MYSVPNERNEKEVGNSKLLIYLCVKVIDEVTDFRRKFGVLKLFRILQGMSIPGLLEFFNINNFSALCERKSLV